MTKRKFFLSIGGYGDTRLGEDWILSGKVLKQTDKINISDKVFVLVNLKENFMKRRRGEKVYSEIKKSLENLYNLYEMIISKIIQNIFRVYLSKYFLPLIYKLTRKDINF